MLKTKSIILLSMLVISAYCTSSVAKRGSRHVKAATSVALDKSLEERMRKTLKGMGLSENELSIYVGLEGEELFAIQAHKKMIPASVTKLVTAAAFLRKFPPGTKFKTQLASAANISEGVLHGDVVLVGGGDPSFVSENMWYLVNAFQRTGVKKIDGDIVVDDSLFDQFRFDPSRQKERVDRAYDAPVGAMSFNWNSVNIFVRPGNKDGDPAKVWADPESEYIRLKANVKTDSKVKTHSVSAERDEDDKGYGDLIKVNGKISPGSKEVVIYKSVSQPDLWSGSQLKSFLDQRGINVTGKIRRGNSPASASILAEYESKPIQEILADMNKFSSNYVAEMLTKNLSAIESRPGTLEAGMKVLNQHMEKIGVPASEYELYNPSGFTRENKMSAFSLWKVIEDLKNDFQLQPELVSSLPIAGIDGTLKNRMKNGSPAERAVRAKTGYLNGVVSLAGYAGRKNGDVVTFVFIYNGGVDEGKVRSCFDQLASHLVDSQ